MRRRQFFISSAAIVLGSGCETGPRCSDCKGKGSNKCYVCEGRGSVSYKEPRGNYIYYGRRRCVNCNGAGSKRCSTCNGTGKQRTTKPA